MPLFPSEFSNSKAAFEDVAFTWGQRLFHFSFPKCGVYWRAEFKSNTVNTGCLKISPAFDQQ